MPITKHIFILFVLFSLAFMPVMVLAQEDLSAQEESASAEDEPLVVIDEDEVIIDEENVIIYQDADAEQEAVTEQAAEVLITADETVTAQDLGVEEPKVLPGSFLYPFKNLWRGVSVAFTFNKIAKAEKRLQHANERIIEAQKLADEKGDEKSLARLGKVMERYEKDLAKVQKTMEKIEDKIDSNPKLEEFIDKFTNSEINRRKVLQKLQANEHVPEKALEKVMRAKEQSAEGFGKILQKVVPKEKIAERIEKALEKQKGSDFKDLKHLQIIKEIGEYVPDEIKEKLKEVEQKRLENIENKLKGANVAEQEKVKKYLEGVKGDTVHQLEVINDLRTRARISGSLLNELGEVEAEKIENFENRVKNIKDENLRERMLNKIQTKEGDAPNLIKQKLQAMPALKEQIQKQKESAPPEKESFFDKVKNIEDKTKLLNPLNFFKAEIRTIPAKSRSQEEMERMRERETGEIKAEDRFKEPVLPKESEIQQGVIEQRREQMQQPPQEFQPNIEDIKRKLEQQIQPRSGVLETKILQKLTPQISMDDSIVIDKRISAGSALAAECQEASYLEERADYIVEAGVSSIDVDQTTNTKTINLGIVAWLKGNKNTNSLQILTSVAEHGESPTFEDNGIYRIYLWELNDKLYFVCEFAGVIDLGYRDWYCHETDGHRNWFKKGSVTVYSDRQIYGPYYDSCAGDTILGEVGCSNEHQYVLTEFYLCENGCSEGACIE